MHRILSHPSYGHDGNDYPAEFSNNGWIDASRPHRKARPS